MNYPTAQGWLEVNSIVPTCVSPVVQQALTVQYITNMHTLVVYNQDIVSAETSENAPSAWFSFQPLFCVSIISTCSFPEFEELLRKRHSLQNFAMLLTIVTSFAHAVWQCKTAICKCNSLVKLFSVTLVTIEMRYLQSLSKMIHDAWRQKFYFRKNKNSWSWVCVKSTKEASRFLLPLQSFSRIQFNSVDVAFDEI